LHDVWRATCARPHVQEDDIYELESEDEDPDAPPDLQHVQARIQEVVRVLVGPDTHRSPSPHHRHAL